MVASCKAAQVSELKGWYCTPKLSRITLWSVGFINLSKIMTDEQHLQKIGAILDVYGR